MKQASALKENQVSEKSSIEEIFPELVSKQPEEKKNQTDEIKAPE